MSELRPFNAAIPSNGLEFEVLLPERAGRSRTHFVLHARSGSVRSGILYDSRGIV